MQVDSLGTVVDDSLLALTASWLNRSHEKITEILYHMAEVNTSTVEGLLTAPIPSELRPLEKLEYRKQVLVRGVSPLLSIVVEAHRRNLRVADSLSLQNRWTRASEAKILTALTYLGNEYGNLGLDALEGYRRESRNYIATTLTQKRAAPEAMVTAIINYIDLSKTYMLQAIQSFHRGVTDGARIGLTDLSRLNMQDDMVRSILAMADTLTTCVREGKRDQGRTEALFNRTGEIYHEDMLAVIEDNVYFLEENLKSVLVTAHQIESEIARPSVRWGWVSARLVRLDPENNPASYNIPVEKMVVPTDKTWVFSSSFENGWESEEYRDNSWTAPEQMEGIRIRAPRLPASDPTAQARQPGHDFYVRKEINIPGIPVSGKVNFIDTRPERLYVNGILLSELSADQAITVTDLLKEGKNLLAMQCASSDSLLLEGGALIHYIPKILTANKE
jgi:hypothetical protein